MLEIADGGGRVDYRAVSVSTKPGLESYFVRHRHAERAGSFASPGGRRSASMVSVDLAVHLDRRPRFEHDPDQSKISVVELSSVLRVERVAKLLESRSGLVLSLLGPGSRPPACEGARRARVVEPVDVVVHSDRESISLSVDDRNFSPANRRSWHTPWHGQSATRRGPALTIVAGMCEARVVRPASRGSAARDGSATRERSSKCTGAWRPIDTRAMPRS